MDVFQSHVHFNCAGVWCPVIENGASFNLGVEESEEERRFSISWDRYSLHFPTASPAVTRTEKHSG
jgi:hypothetical protein